MTSPAGISVDRSGALGDGRELAVEGSGVSVSLVRVFGLDLVDTTLEDAARFIIAHAMGGKPAQIAFLNAHAVNVMHRDPAYRTALARCDRVFADGVGVRISALAAGVALRENVNGTDLLPPPVPTNCDCTGPAVLHRRARRDCR